MGKVLSVMTRKSRRFNAENRAHRFLDKEKLPPAPKFQSNLTDYNRVQEEIPNFAQMEGKKHSKLDEHLKHVYVTSLDNVSENVTNRKADSAKPLPLNRKPVEDFEFGYKEPEKVARGRATLRQALNFIGDHQTEPNTWSAEKISEEYKLQPRIVENILKNFHTFEVYLPDIKAKEKILIRDKLKHIWNLGEPKVLPPPTYAADEPPTANKTLLNANEKRQVDDDYLERLIKDYNENETKKQPKV